MSLFLALLVLAAITCIPALELRASIPVGFFALAPAVEKTARLLGLDHVAAPDLHWSAVVAVCLLANVFLGLLVYEILLPCLRAMRRWGWFDRRVWPFFERRQEKLRPTVEKYGEWGLALFIGIPLPGTGAVTGAVGAFLLGFRRRRFYLANLAGVLLAGLCVTALCLLIQNGVVADDSWLRKLFIKEI